MYRSKKDSSERNFKMSEKEMRKNEERRIRDDFLMSYDPPQIYQSELRKIVVNIQGNSSPEESSEPPLQYDLGDPELFTVCRRRGEGSKPVFANVVVNQKSINASEARRSIRKPLSPAYTSSYNRDCSQSRQRSISRSPSRSRTPHKSSSSHHRHSRSSMEPETYKTSSYRPSRIGNVHRCSSKLIKSSSHSRFPSESSSYDRSPKRHRSRDSSNRSPRRSPNKRVNSPSRRISPRRYSPNRKHSPSRSSRRPSPSSRLEYERDRERYRHHSDKGRDFSSRRSPDRRSNPRRHYSPPRINKLPAMTVPGDPPYHGFYPVPLSSEYWMGLAHATAPMLSMLPQLLSSFMPRPVKQSRIPDDFVPHAQHLH